METNNDTPIRYVKDIPLMSRERIEFCQSNKLPAITSLGWDKGLTQPNINGAKLVYFIDGKEHTTKIQHLTKGGYFSKKAINMFNIDRVERPTDRKSIIHLDESELQFILDNYTNLDGKIFQTEGERVRTEKASAMVKLASMIDFHDRG